MQEQSTTGAQEPLQKQLSGHFIRTIHAKMEHIRKVSIDLKLIL